MDNYSSSLKKVTEEYVGTDIFKLFEAGIEFAPYLGKLINFRKMNRFERRIKENSAQLKRIQSLSIQDSKTAEIVQEIVGPIILSDLIEEHEDAKIRYILNGIENIFIDEKDEEILIYSYYDTLRQLRYNDIKRLYYYAGLDEPPGEVYFGGSELDALMKSVDLKLSNLYLIDIMGRHGAILGPTDQANRDNTRVNSFGVNFLRFFIIEEEIKQYLDAL